MLLQFQVVFKQGVTVVSTALGRPVDPAHLTIKDIAETVIETEQFLERLTGLRCHISQAGHGLTDDGNDAVKTRAATPTLRKKPHWMQTPEGKERMRRIQKKAWRKRKNGK